MTGSVTADVTPEDAEADVDGCSSDFSRIELISAFELLSDIEEVFSHDMRLRLKTDRIAAIILFFMISPFCGVALIIYYYIITQ